jgi:hypothetical protein
MKYAKITIFSTRNGVELESFDWFEIVALQLTPRHLQLINCNYSKHEQRHTVIEIAKMLNFPTHLNGAELVSLDNKHAKKGTIYR